MGDGRLAGRRALVTGAGAGMGRAITERFLREGAEVFAADVDAAALARLSKAAAAPRLATVVMDVASQADCARAAERVSADGGGLDILVNNAAIFPSTPFDEMTFEAWRAVMTVNLDGLFLVTKALFPLMKERGWGRIINISSSSFFAGTANASHYIASKGGVIGFSRSLASEVGQHGITVNVVTPGLTLTETVKGKTSPELIETRRRQRPLQRDQQPGDIVGAVLFLATEDSDFVTGQIVNVDGGGIRH